jgi:hypothetical protein
VELSKLIPIDLLKEIYTDLAKPGAKNVGKAIGTILGLGNTILIPIHLLNERARAIATRNLESFRRRLQHVRPEDIMEPAPEIAVPILERLMYVSDEKIAGLYVALLASASRRDFTGCAHPCFIQIIQALTPDEALILKFLSGSEVIGYETLRAGAEHESGYARRSRVTAFPKDLGLAFPEKATLYCENLEGLGILEDRKSPLKLSSHYKSVAKVTEPILKRWKEEQPDLTLSRVRGHYHLTRLGAELVIACGYDDPKKVKSLQRFWA